MTASGRASALGRLPQALVLCALIYPFQPLRALGIDHLYSLGVPTVLGFWALLLERPLQWFGLPRELMVLLAVVVALAALRWSVTRSLALLVCVPALVLQAYLLFLGVAAAPALFLTGCLLLVGLPLLEPPLGNQDPPSDARLRGWEVALLAGGALFFGLVLQGVGDRVLDSVAAGIGAASGALGAGWHLVLAGLGVTTSFLAMRAHGRGLLGAVGAVFVAGGVDRWVGPGYGVMASLACAPLLVFGLRSYLRRGFEPLGSWPLWPPFLSAALVPWTFIALVCAGQAYLFGAWDCGRLDGGARRITTTPGAFQALPYPDGERVLVSHRDAERVVLHRIADGDVLAELDVSGLLDGRTWSKVAPEVLTWTPWGVGVVLSVPDGKVMNPVLLLQPDTLEILRRNDGVLCDELTDLAVHSREPLLVAGCPTGGSEEQGLIYLDPASLEEVDRQVTPGFQPDRFDFVPGGTSVFWTSMIGGAPGLFDTATGEGRTSLFEGDLNLDVAVTPDGETGLATRYLFGEVVHYSLDSLAPVARTRVGYGARAVGCGGDACYVASAVTGQLHRILPTDRQDRWYVGGHVRRVDVDEAGAAFLSGDCGLVEVR